MLVGLALCLLGWSGLCQAGVLVAPAVVEAEAVQVGDEIVISCTELAGQEQVIALSLGLFNQDSEGRVVFQEDEEAQARAAQIIELPCQEFPLQPYERKGLTIRVASADFASSYLVLFVQPKQTVVSSRLAVLLLLATASAREQVHLADVQLQRESLALTFHNSGTRHGRAAGIVAAYDGAGQLVGEFVVQSGRILPNRQGTAQLTVPPEVHSVQFSPLAELGGQIMVSDAAW